MISSFYTSATGAINLQSGFDVTANNIANVSTVGYKPSSASFADLIYTNIHAEPGADSQLKSGHGTKLEKTDTLFNEGGLRQTGRALDYALVNSNNYFAVESNGEVKYTRNGNFHLSVEDGTSYLVSSDGGYVLDANGSRIAMESEKDTPAIGVFSVKNEDGLVRSGNTCFQLSNLSGAAAAVTDPEMKQNYLEDSAVNIADQMTSVIEMQRAFQFNSKMVQLSDEIMQTVNSLR
ncbi:flagellar hook-basal body protein [Clostridium sp. KNHs216]|uniref:flagellar hook-basal body protein n=1 Tax=Eubacteriales TaxID=186802 RepID=UPI00114F7EF3|nr:flagellar hook-basal body protein [Clostridium sp. KNHs216]TQI65464.1 flagellar basal-body rod protein FlgG [Clostridium sp. KNHs216]